jgi:YgiT-type zinc finger domain-containing protein
MTARARHTGTARELSETCYFCARGVLEERRVTVDFRWGEKLTIIHNVPATVCNECGERYYDASVVEQMEALAVSGPTQAEVRVPVATLPA